MSQNRSRRRGPHKAASPGHVPRLRGTRAELRGRWCVRRPGAAPGDRPAGERNPTPGIPRWTEPGTVRAAPAHSGTGTGNKEQGMGLGAVAADYAHSPLSKGTFSPTPQRNGRGGRSKHLRTSPLALVPLPVSVCCLSVPPSPLPSFLLPVHR